MDLFTSMVGHDRNAAVVVTEDHMAAMLADGLESEPSENAVELAEGYGRQSQAGTSTRSIPAKRVATGPATAR